MNIIKDQKLDDLYEKKKFLEIKRLELEQEKLSLELARKKLMSGMPLELEKGTMGGGKILGESDGLSFSKIKRGDGSLSESKWI